MRLTSAIISSVALFLALASDGRPAQDRVDKDSPLTRPLKVVQLQGGFAGFTGVQYTIAPDGSWTFDSIFREKITPKRKGKLTMMEMAKLGALLEKYAVAKLPAKSGKEPGANPHTITIEFNNKKASLVGRTPPRLNPKDPAGTVESRFAGIWEGIVGLLSPPAKEK